MRAEYLDHLGSDLTVVNSARASFDKESEWANPFYEEEWEYPELKSGDKKFISYLATHGHWSPFSHPQITLRYTVPIFVARQEFKHIVGFTRNEVSRRYVDDEPEFFVPDVWRSRPEGSVKQGSGASEIDNESLKGFDVSCLSDWMPEEIMSLCKSYYEHLLRKGVAPEQARMILPQSMYTSYYVTGSLAAFARFYRQRTDSHAQVEIQELAHQVGAIIGPLYPVSWIALTEL